MIVVTSGYRTKATNDALLPQGIDVARKSYHPVGLGGRLGLGGAGRYRTFVHLDTGPSPALGWLR
jgi:uncharacterized protein YcbK (DUF882 family)